MSLLLYTATAAVLLWLAHRLVLPLGRWSAAILFLLPFCLVGRALLTGGVYGPVDLPYLTEPLRDMRVPLGVPPWHNGLLSDLYAQMIPWRKAVQFALQHHQWPLWNPFILSGSLLAASAQPAVYSPFTLLACLLPIGDGLTYSAAIAFFIAGLGAFLFAREIGCRPAAALIASAAWMYSMPIAFFVLWAVGGSWALLPLVLLGTRRCVWRPGVASATLLMIALTLLLLAGHPETVVHAIFIGGVYGIFEMARRPSAGVAQTLSSVPAGTEESVPAQTGVSAPHSASGAVVNDGERPAANRSRFATLAKSLLPAIASALAAGIIALLLCAIYVLPILDAAPQSADYQSRRAWAHQPHGVIGAQSVARLITDFFPFLAAQRWNIAGVQYVPLDSSAVGSIVLALALYAVIRVRKKETWFFLAVAIFGLLARAAWGPVINTLGHLPLFGMTILERFSFAAAFSFSILAALAAEELMRRGRDRAAEYVFFGALVFFTAGTMWIRAGGIAILKIFPEFGHYAEVADVLGLALAALVVIWRPALLLPLLLFQRTLAAYDLYPTLPRFAAYPPIPILQPLKDIHEPFRIVAQHHGFIPGTSALYELEDVRGYEALTLGSYIGTYPLWCVAQPIWFNRVDDLTRPFLSFLNVRYAITTGPPPEGWHTVAQQRGSRLVENERVLPRAFIPRRMIVGESGAGDTLDEMRQTADFGDVAWIDAPMPRHEERNGVGVMTIEPRPNGFRFHVTMGSPGRIVVSEPAWKGWRAYIDGRRVRMQTANLSFLAIYVPEGAHTIRLQYLPDAFVRGRAISAVTLAALIVFAIARLFGRRGALSRQ